MGDLVRNGALVLLWGIAWWMMGFRDGSRFQRRKSAREKYRYSSILTARCRRGERAGG